MEGKSGRVSKFEAEDGEAVGGFFSGGTESILIFSFRVQIYQMKSQVAGK